MTQTNNEREALLNKFREIIAEQGWQCRDMTEKLIDAAYAHIQSPISQNEQQEAVGYIDRNQLMRWETLRGTDYEVIERCCIGFSKEPFQTELTDCTLPVYLSPPKQAIPEGWDEIKKDAERYRWLRGVSRDPDESSPHCVVTEEVLEKGKAAKMVSYLVFDEKLDAEIDKMLNAAPNHTEVGE